MASPLLVTSESFRKKLIVRNLVPYPKSPSKTNPPIDYEAPISDYSVTDSPDVLIDEPGFSNQLYKVNQYGADGGYKQVPDPTALLNSKSNEGEYGFQDAKLIDEGYEEARKYRPVNAYADGLNIIDSAEAFSSLETITRDGNRLPNGQPYYPLQFVPSRYRNVSILLSRDPQGSDGLLSQDSYIARLGADLLRREFEQRIAAEIRLNTIGRINAFNVRGGTDILSLATGRVPIIEPNYRITSPANPILAATDFALRLAGTIIPVSTIPGSYFDPSINSGQPVTIQQLNNAFRRSGVGKFVSSLLGTNRSGSQLFLDNTGGGQKSRLFGNLDYNRYKPGYSRTVFDRLAGALVGANENNSNFYIGSITSEPSRIFSPSGVLPVNSFGQEQQSPVYGPSELATLYEAPPGSTATKSIRLGANGVAYVNGGGIEGGLTWISPGTSANAGKNVGKGGQVSASTPVRKQSSFDETESTKLGFKDGSIMYNTQKLIDSAEKSGAKRLQHVGNAIDQVSKVFHDGYKEMTKGSRVVTYTASAGKAGAEVGGTEYCRVFTKDVPYLQYGNLQKVDGSTIQNRKIASSVLDNTYNLNIYPNKKDGTANSTNLFGNPDTDGYAKKYMFSIENLAWRTSSKPGFTWADLPICERGPNGGRVMWFPPYGLTFSESSNASWKDSSFIGRPEPIYTYSNTSRTGSLSWKIVVDHPSVLNVIVDQVLKDEKNRDIINDKIESFFAGCLKYDLYELAKQYKNINPNDLYVIQQELNERQLTKEQVDWVKRDLQTGSNSTTEETKPVAKNEQLNLKSLQTEIEGLGFYFSNNSPQGKIGSSVDSYSTYYTSYISSKQQVIDNAPTKTDPLSNPIAVGEFFNKVIEPNFVTFKEKLNKIAKFVNDGTIESININLVGTTSAKDSQTYNATLSQNRIDSVKKFIQEYSIGDTTIGKKLGNNLTFKDDANGETSVTVKKGLYWGDSFKCTDRDSLAPNNDVDTVNAMACRRVAIKSITFKAKQGDNPQPPTPQVAASESTRIQQISEVTVTEPTEVTTRVFRNNITKRVLRLMMSECNYFESIKENTPMVYDNLKTKLQFFNPAFHSTTPEGLNSRLTFLQQCMRPGETIPVVKSVNGKETLQYNNAVNTSFGAPPVLILRVGDFYNTQIIPDGLQIQYENLDLNPEGIGIQPMIANVTLNFKFVGGSGIKDAVDRIQNALSFNYYANTEMYDDRSDVTDFSLDELDKQFKDLFPIPPPTPAQVQNNNGQNNNSFIGQILAEVVTESGTTGEVLYTPFISSFVTETQNYFNTIYNKNREVLNQYNESVRQIWTYGRGYTKGRIPPINSESTYLFGKPLTYQDNFKEIFLQYNFLIEYNSDKFLNYLQDNKNLSDKVQRQVKQNYLNLITSKQSGFENSVTKIVQDIINLEQKYAKDLQRLLIITFGTQDMDELLTGTDGFQNQKGNVSTFFTSGSGLTSLTRAKDTIEESLRNFNSKSEAQTSFTASNGKSSTGVLVQPATKKFSKDVPFEPISKNSEFDNTSFVYQYTIFSQEVTDDKKYEGFKNSLINNIISNPSLMENSNPNLEKIVDDYWIGICKPIFTEENKLAGEFLDSIGRQELKDYLNFTAIDKTKEIKLNFSNVSGTTEDTLIEARNNYIVSLANTTNINTDNKTFNDASSGPSGNIYISKAKFN